MKPPWCCTVVRAVLDLWSVNPNLPSRPPRRCPHSRSCSTPPQGTRFFLSLNKAGYFVYLDTTDPYKPKVLQALHLGDGSSPHYITPVGPGDNRVVVADYFLDQGTIGKVHAGGNKKVGTAGLLTGSSRHACARCGQAARGGGLASAAGLLGCRWGRWCRSEELDASAVRQ